MADNRNEKRNREQVIAARLLAIQRIQEGKILGGGRDKNNNLFLKRSPQYKSDEFHTDMALLMPDMQYIIALAQKARSLTKKYAEKMLNKMSETIEKEIDREFGRRFGREKGHDQSRVLDRDDVAADLKDAPDNKQPSTPGLSVKDRLIDHRERTAPQVAVKSPAPAAPGLSLGM